MLKHKALIDKMTLEEKAGLCSGKDFWHLKSINRLSLNEIMACDGPHGLRKQNAENEKVGIGNSYPATCFPTAASTACTWNKELENELGKALGEECLEQQVSVLLGPGVNMKRSPLCGRNFEYFSEDPVLAGEMAASFINGVQSKGIGTSLKHFATNSQETNRMTNNSIVDERALREIYLQAFEIAVKKAKPWTVMNAYNLLNGEYCSENDTLQNKILRDEWGFKGVVVSDWGAVNNRVKGLKSGNDIEMPSSGGYNDKKIINAVKRGEIEESVLDTAVDRIITLILNAQKSKKKNYSFSKEAHHLLAEKIAAEAMVLLKNEDGILPISKDDGLIAVIGALAEKPRYQGAGSSLVNTTKLDNGCDSLKALGMNVRFANGYSKTKVKKEAEDKLISEACELAKSAKKVIVFAGLTEEYESEGFDRKGLDLPSVQNRLIEELAAINNNIIVVLAGGSPVTMPWLGNVKAVINSYLSGQAGGMAAAEILIGKVNPSGKLAETYPLSLNDTPTAGRYPAEGKTSVYNESIYIGYRYYDKTSKQVLFPFGYGLSYTEFKYSSLKINKKKFKKGDTCSVTLKVKNTGSLDGAETVQLYVGKEQEKIFRAPKELKAFDKVFLKPGEEKTIEFNLDDRAFSFYNTKVSDWCIEGGKYYIMAAASSKDIRQTATLNCIADDCPVPEYDSKCSVYFTGDPQNASEEAFISLYGKPIPENMPACRYDFNTTIGDSKAQGLGKLLYNTMNMAGKKAGGINRGMIINTVLETPVRNYVSMSNGLFTQEMANGFLMILNPAESSAKGTGKIVKGVPNAILNLKKLLKSI